MSHPLDQPLPRRKEARDLEARLQNSLSTERKNLIKEAERFYWNELGKRPKRQPSLSDLLDDALHEWIKKQEKIVPNKEVTK